MKTMLWVLALCGAAQATPARPGLVATLEGGEASKLAQAIVHARRDDAAGFARVAALGGVRAEVYGRSRARRPNVARELRALGPAALWPMLALSTEGMPATRALAAEERLALERGLVEALGELRDARAGAVLRAALVGGPGEVAEAAGVAVGKLCGARELDALLGVSRQAAGARRDGAIAGLGWCHGEAATARLAELVYDTSAALAAVHALGTAGSTWAWQTGSVGDAATGERVRATAAAALVHAAALGVDSAEVGAELQLLDRASVTAALASARASATPEALARLARLPL